jgi:Tfp pilus assembly protein PilF
MQLQFHINENHGICFTKLKKGGDKTHRLTRAYVKTQEQNGH